MDVLAMPDVVLKEIIQVINKVGDDKDILEFSGFKVPEIVHDTVEATSKYAKYLIRQETEMARWKKAAMLPLPKNIEYSRDFFPSLSAEELEKLRLHRPATLHAAGQIQVSILYTIIYIIIYTTLYS